jgi:hypothetical protein
VAVGGSVGRRVEMLLASSLSGIFVQEEAQNRGARDSSRLAGVRDFVQKEAQ